MGSTRRKDGVRQTTEESGIVTRAGQEETREANAEMGYVRRQERRKTGRRRQETEEGGKD